MTNSTSVKQLLEETVQASARAMYVVVFFSMCINILMLASPIYMLQIFDRVLSSRSIDTLILLSVIIVFALLTLALLEAVRGNILIRIGKWIDRRLAGAMLMGSISGPLKMGSEPSTQSLRDLQSCRTFISGSEVFSFLDAPWAPVFLLVLFFLHPMLGYISLTGAVVLFSLAVINEIFTRKSLHQSGKLNIAAMRQAESAVRNADVIEAMGLMPNLLQRWDKENAEAIRTLSDASVKSSSIVAVSRFFRMLFQIAILGTGAWLVIANELTPGGMIAGSILMGRCLAPVEQAINSWKSAIAARNAYRRLQQHASEAPERIESMTLPAPQGQVSVEGMSYAHPGEKEFAIRGISFKLEAGQALGIIGPSSSGKTTLLRLLLGNLSPNAGQVRLDGMDVSQWAADDLGKYCGYLPQDIELFSASVRENIARMGEGDPDEVVRAAQQAGCHDMILRLPRGYDTAVGEGGSSLSGGERQRIALARALYGSPNFVVLDEPNANLDAVGEAALLKAIEQLKAAKVTVVIVGHRPNVVQHVDYLLVLSEGRMHDFDVKEKVMERLAENARAANLSEAGQHG